MREEFVVEGVNFMAVVPVEIDLCECPYFEAATKALERGFCPQRKNAKEVLLMKGKVTIGHGPNLFVWKNGDLGDDAKMHTVKFVDAAKNAGLPPDYVRWLESI